MLDKVLNTPPTIPLESSSQPKQTVKVLAYGFEKMEDENGTASKITLP